MRTDLLSRVCRMLRASGLWYRVHESQDPEIVDHEVELMDRVSLQVSSNPADRYVIVLRELPDGKYSTVPTMPGSLELEVGLALSEDEFSRAMARTMAAGVVRPDQEPARS